MEAIKDWMKAHADKMFHFVFGALLALLGTGAGAWLSYVLNVDWMVYLVPVLLVTAVAVGKEIWDSYGHGTKDEMDFVATVAGGASVVLAVFIASVAQT
jgi:hypothetical protein